MSYRNVYFSLLLLVACSFVSSLARAYASCEDGSDGRCPQGQRCESSGRTGKGACVPEPPPMIGSVVENRIASDGLGHGNSSHAPSQGPDCYANSDCRTGYNCEKGDLDPTSSGYSTYPGIRLRTPPACRADTDCLSDEYCERRHINNAMGGVCLVRPPVAANH